MPLYLWASRFAYVVGLVGLVFLGTAARAQTGQPAPAKGAAAPAQPAPPPEQVATSQPQLGGEPAPTDIRLRSLEQKVDALKEQAWRVKARVGMLKEAVLGGGVGARASIVHENQMGGSFRMVRLVYALDGAQIFARADDTGKLNDLKTIDILSGPIAPGNHTISVLIDYRGNGYGVFSYLNEYKFNVKSSHTFTAAEGKQTQVNVIALEHGGITSQLKDRPAVEFKVSVAADKPGAAPAPATTPPPAAPATTPGN